jgi:hypothetical protein
MRRIVGGLILLAIVFTLPFVNIAQISEPSGEMIMTLDICSMHSQANTSDTSTIAEPFFDVSSFQPEAEFPENTFFVQDYIFSSRIDKPPTV